MWLVDHEYCSRSRTWAFTEKPDDEALARSDGTEFADEAIMDLLRFWEQRVRTLSAFTSSAARCLKPISAA